ncbi:helix-turn-helix domain-containing protein [Streptococcus sp. S784/96/1]|uniref:helix-turn-helix domain-containing protein n=1 Tax=Streptococcus sp. S784/96/1 TaxID=2653499 RepID=UPI00138948C1|nr:helix-turn-helix domain-containing protein [Streptococcus sp. S784/96/1]
MLSGFGQKVRDLREGLHITREEFCGDETELSIRQLARIESGQSIPTLAKVEYIAQQLGVTVGSLTDGENLELPKRYKELKYLILRTPTYLDEERLKIREEQFDEIFEEYYDELPEAEQVTIDIIQSRFEVFNSGNIDFGTDILQDYFEQAKKKKVYNINDLALIDLYFMCSIASNFDEEVFDVSVFNTFIEKLLDQKDLLPIDDFFYLNKVYIILCFTLISLDRIEEIDFILEICYQLMLKIQDFQRMPIYYLYKWKYILQCLGEKQEACQYYQQAIMFSEMIQDSYLKKQIEEEWKKDMQDN